MVEEDSLEERVRNSIPNNAQTPNTNTASSIDDVVEKDSWPNPNPDTLDKKLKLDKKTGFFGKIWDVIKYVPILAGQFLLFGSTAPISTAITAIGFAIGGYFEAKKAGKKYTWRRLRRELYSGNIFGFFDYAVFKVPDYFSNVIPFFGLPGLIPKIAKTILFEALALPPAVTAYRAVEYIKDQMGWGNFFKKIFTFRIPSVIKEIYENAIKGKVWKGSKQLYKFAPLHFFQLNYLPTIQLRMAQSAFINNPIFRYVLGKKEQKKQPKDNVIPMDRQYRPRDQYRQPGYKSA